MYSQYSRYAPQTSVTTTQQSGSSWNGSAWVPSAHPSQSRSASTHSTYASAVTRPPVEDAATTYTNYYHRWIAHASSQEALAKSLAEGSNAQQEALRQVAWAKHYANQSSAAAHYYHPQGVKQANTQPPPLPPAPPTTAAATASATSQPAAVQQKAPPQENGGLKRYVHRCLMAVEVSKRDEMQKQIQKVIAEAIEKQSLHSTDWDRKPLLSLGDENAPKKTPASDSTEKKRSHQTAFSESSRRNASTSDTYYGRGSRDDTFSSYGPASSSGSYGRSSDKGSYYGPSSGSHGHGQPQKRSHSQDDYGYYGRTSPTETASATSEQDYLSLSPSQSKGKKQKKQKKNKSKADYALSQMNKHSLPGLDKSSNAMRKRANRFSGPGGIQDSTTLAPASDVAKYMGKALIGGKTTKLDESDYEKMTVKGTCSKKEKEYLRLTAPPRAERVRPKPILEGHLSDLKEEWARPKHRDYIWFCSQLKAVRQDLTVQRIFDSFAVDVYETHARISLEEGDLNEYNQCQTQLKELYTSLPSSPHSNEFIAYRMLYYVFLTGNKKYQEGSKDLFQIMLHLSSQQRQDDAIAHALKVRVAVAEFDYHAFFRLSKESPTSHGVYLLKKMEPGMRQSALYRMCKAYRPSLSIHHVLGEVGLENTEDGRKWLESCGCVLDGDLVVTSNTVVRESDLEAKSSLI